LSTEDIDVVQVEAGMYAGSPRHVPFHRFTGYLEPMGYHLVRDLRTHARFPRHACVRTV